MDLVASLEDMDFPGLDAANADEVITMLESDPAIRTMIKDVSMPGTMNGFALSGPIDIYADWLEGSRILNVLARYSSLAGKKRPDLCGMVAAALSYETVVFGRLADSTACAVGIRFAMPFSRCGPDLLEAIVVDVLRWLLRVRLFHKRDHGSRTLVSG